MKVRMMRIRCNSCRDGYPSKGAKFNSRKEVVTGQTYLGIKIFRFYGKCTECNAEITINTDPRNSDYVVESGGTRCFKPWRVEDEEAGKERWRREVEEKGDVLKSLERKTLDSKRAMDVMAALEELKSVKSRHATVSVDAMLEALQRNAAERKKLEEEEDEKLIKSIFQRTKDVVVRRISDEDFNDGDLKRRKLSEEVSRNPSDAPRVKATFKSSVMISVVKKPAQTANGNIPRKTV